MQAETSNLEPGLEQRLLKLPTLQISALDNDERPAVLRLPRELFSSSYHGLY